MKFYDTCSLLRKTDELILNQEKFILSSITLAELENIKTSATKDPLVKFEARKLTRFLNDNEERYEVYPFTLDQLEIFTVYNLQYEINNDLKIFACALAYARTHRKHGEEPVQFVTEDLALRSLSKSILKFFKDFTGYDSRLELVKEEEKENDYCGYKTVVLGDQELEEFYKDLSVNRFNLLVNEYLIIKDTDKKIVDRRCWTGETHRIIKVENFNSVQFGKVGPKKEDVYQLFACDSLNNNQITMVKGPAGSGKTFLSLGFLFHKLERKEIDKIIIFCNTVATKNSAKLGYYPGTKNEKLLDSQIGNMLASKIGDKLGVERLIDENKIILLPLSDIRGYDTSDGHNGVYISEAQNLDITLMKLALQRIGENSICIIDGDDKTQVDDISYAGVNNGMKRVSEVFKGQDIYGEVELKTIYRSRIADIAEQM